MDLYWKVSVVDDNDFQRLFKGYYRIRQRPAAWYAQYFRMLEQLKTTNRSFREVLQELYERTGRLEVSFASKMLATRNPELPVIDRWVLDNLQLRLPGYLEQDRVQKVVQLYDRIVTWYHEFLKTPTGKQALRMFDNLISHCDITAVKKIDFILWQTRTNGALPAPRGTRHKPSVENYRTDHRTGTKGTRNSDYLQHIP